jgi:tetratricopeptide (TPR) repeat protein
MNKNLFRIFLFILIFSPLAFGTVEIWSLEVMESACFLALLILLSEKLRKKETYLYEIPGIIPILVLLGLILFQLMPLPPGVIRSLSPETYEIYKKTIFMVDPDALVSLSINKKATLAEFLRFASYVCMYVLTIQLLKDKDNLQKTVIAIAIFVSLLSLFAILQHFLPNDRIFWIRELTRGGKPFGPYVNRNHYAGLIGMIFPVLMGLFLFYKPHVLFKSFRKNLIELFSLQKTNIFVLIGFSLVLAASSVFLTLSRSGIISLGISTIVFGLMVLAKAEDRKAGLIVVIIFFLIVITVGWFGWSPIIERFSGIKNAEIFKVEDRFIHWKDSENIIKDFFAAGTGFGTFVHIYPAYRSVVRDLVLEHAHNDYMELIIEGGFVAIVLFSWFLAELFYKSYKAFTKRRERYSVYISKGSIAGIISILIFSFTDFNLHIGANGLYFFFLLGLAVSAANTRVREGSSDTYLKKKNIPIKLVIISLSAVALLGLYFNSSIFMGRIFFSSVKDEKLNGKTSDKELLSVRDTLYRASIADLLEARYKFAVANVEKLMLNNDVAVKYYMEAVKLNPVNGEYLQMLGFVMWEMKSYDNAEKLIKAGITYDITNTYRYKRYATWLFAVGRKEEGLRIMEEAITLEPNKTRDYITLMVLNRLSDEEIQKSLPKRVEPFLLFSDYLFQTGRVDWAEDMYLKALQYLQYEKRIEPSYFYRVASYYIKRNKLHDALNIMNQALANFPGDVRIIIGIGEIYEKLGMDYQALEQYRKALLVEHQNEEAMKKLDILRLKMNENKE